MYTPSLNITNGILKNIGLIEASKAIIDTAPLLPSWEKRFQEEAALRTVHHGTHLEGNDLNITETKKVIEGKKIVARKRDIQEVVNYRNVIEYIGKTTEQTIDNTTINKLHELTTENILPKEKIGTHRRTQVVIRNSLTGEISFKPPPAVEIPYLLKDFLIWLNQEKTTHTILKAAITHYELVRIHPYTDGNGRVARAATMLLLYQEGYDIRRFFSLEEYYDKHAEAYYQALQSVQPTADLTPWLEYFTEGLAIELTRIKEKIEKISRDINLKQTLGGHIYLNERQLKVIEYIQEYGFIQNKQFKYIFPNISDDTVLRELSNLIKKNILKKTGKTKAARYVLA